MFNLFKRSSAPANLDLAVAAEVTGEQHGPSAPTKPQRASIDGRDPLKGLWIDEPNAKAVLKDLQLPEQTATDVEHFIDLGYLIVRNAIPPDVIDEVVLDAQRVLTEPAGFVIRDKGAYVNPTGLGELGLGHRIIDLYGVSPAAREAVFTERVSNLLQTCFGEPAIGIQSLYFEYGSQQAVHQDTAYVVSRQPLALAAIWIALEDVMPGTGELCYYPGGHRFPHFLFGGDRKHFIMAKDGQETHQAFFNHLKNQAAERGIPLETFLPRKGDVLVWHADLPHGGSRIQQSQTRRSLVVHFAPASVQAQYLDRIGADYHELPAPRGNFFSSRHYRLAELDPTGRAPILFDGGVSRR